MGGLKQKAQQLVPRSGGLLNDIISKSRSTGGLTAEVGYALATATA
jgi:hypothetical protein